MDDKRGKNNADTKGQRKEREISNHTPITCLLLHRKLFTDFIAAEVRSFLEKKNILVVLEMISSRPL